LRGSGQLPRKASHLPGRRDRVARGLTALITMVVCIICREVREIAALDDCPFDDILGCSYPEPITLEGFRARHSTMGCFLHSESASLPPWSNLRERTIRAGPPKRSRRSGLPRKPMRSSRPAIFSIAREDSASVDMRMIARPSSGRNETNPAHGDSDNHSVRLVFFKCKLRPSYSTHCPYLAFVCSI
jgi:hypothetical protein